MGGRNWKRRWGGGSMRQNGRWMAAATSWGLKSGKNWHVRVGVGPDQTRFYSQPQSSTQLMFFSRKDFRRVVREKLDLWDFRMKTQSSGCGRRAQEPDFCGRIMSERISLKRKLRNFEALSQPWRMANEFPWTIDSLQRMFGNLNDLKIIVVYCDVRFFFLTYSNALEDQILKTNKTFTRLLSLLIVEIVFFINWTCRTKSLKTLKDLGKI